MGWLWVALVVFISATAMAADPTSWLLRNPTPNRYEDAPVRLGLPVGGDEFVVEIDGKEVAYQIQKTPPAIWVAASVGPQTDQTYRVRPGKPAATAPAVQLGQTADAFTLDNGAIALRLPARREGEAPSPIAAVRLGSAWVGRGAWQTGLKLKRFVSEVADHGPVFTSVRLRYEFDGMAGVDGATPAFAQVTVRLARSWRHVEIAEEFAMPAGSAWDFDTAAGWKPTLGRSKPFSAGPGSGSVPSVPKAQRPLSPGGLPFDRPALFINLVPRWNQHYKDGWHFAASDGQQAVGVMPARLGRWTWPQDNALQVVVRESGDYAGIRCPTQRGRRLWWLLAGADASPAGQADVNYFLVHSFEDLDKINRDFILDWPGQKGGWFRINPYDSGQINPTGQIRGIGREAAANAGKAGNLTTLYRVQVLNHPDTYGSYWDFCSPENPNFFSDYIRVPVMLTTQFKAHPRFEELRLAAEMKVREDVYHTATLPSGAGQECPGYMHSWARDANVCKEHLGFDPMAWPQTGAMARFLQRTAFPDGSVRRKLPMGDTHPGPDGSRAMDVPPETVGKFATEELAGFGAVFSSKPGTPQETYLAFKSGPNRGHYHGDQLSFHYGAGGKPVAVDHHCSYAPRAGQEHMHNRVAFFADDMPHGNMDGYERLIAFKASQQVDVAMGQVESARLRACSVLPPETWHQDWPHRPVKGGLVYRRIVVFVKGGAKDYFAIRDQWTSADPALRAAFCLHVTDPSTVALHVEQAGKGIAADGSAVVRDPEQDFGKLGVRAGWMLHLGGVSKGRTDTIRFRQERYEVTAVAGNSLTLDRAVGPETNTPYVLLRPTYRSDGQSVRFGGVTLFVAAPEKTDRLFFPWFHTNGGAESTQGMRLQTSGQSGEFVTVLYPGGDVPVMSAIDGGVRVGDDEIRFAGGIEQDAAKTYVTVARAGKELLRLTGQDIDLDRFQGEVGLFVPDAGYPFGPMPDWLVRQRLRPPPWQIEYVKRLTDLRQAAMTK